MQSITRGPQEPSTWPVWEVVRHKFVRWLRVLVLFTTSLLFLAPLIWTLATSLRTPIESFTVPPQWIPKDPDFSNYVEVFKLIPFEANLLNSLIVTLSCDFLQLVTCSLAGYAFARLEFPGRDILFWVVMATMMIPLQATIIPVFVLISRLGLADTLSGLILPGAYSAFGVFLLRQYFMAVPIELEEAAIIDGANQFQIFSKVYLPLVKNGLIVQGVLCFNYFWNEYFRPLIFLSSREKFTLPLATVDLQGYMGTGSISVVLAGVVLSLIPVFILFSFGQRYLIEGVMKGGLKG